MSESAWQKMHDKDTLKPFAPSTTAKTSFTQGGVHRFGRNAVLGGGADKRMLQSNELREGFYGWMGLGGSVFQWHPELEIGFGFALTQMYWFDVMNAKAAKMQAEVVKCARKIKENTEKVG